MRIWKNKNSAKADFEQFLKDYNCTYKKNSDDQGSIYYFDYQGGHFVAALRKNDDCVEVTYHNIASVPMSQLPLVRSQCNHFNGSNILFKYTYSIYADDNEVGVHLSFFNNKIDPKTLASELGAAFHFQHDWILEFDKAVARSKDYDSIDTESELYKHHHEMYMIRRLELLHQSGPSVANIASGKGPLALWQFLDIVSPLPAATPLFMMENTLSGQQRIEDEEAIRTYDLRRALVDGEGQQARLTRDYVTLDLHYKQGQDEQPRMLTIAITAEGDDKQSIYSRVTVTQVPRNASRMNSLTSESRKSHCVSILIALDRNDEKQRQQEFEYMWTDALLKIKNGKVESMDEDQVMLSQVNAADVAYNLYWGQQMFNQERFYEAILYLENVFYSYRENLLVMKTEHMRTMMEVAYKLGFCYNELGLPKLAFYYLDLMASDGNIRHTMELVNAMANSKDLRLFSYTDGVLNEVKHNFSDEEELPAHILDFVNFLRRRRGYAFIEFNQLDKAEEIFTQMLNEEDNADYAINELAYIKQLRKLRETGADTVNEDSHASDGNLESSDDNDPTPPF